MSVYENTDVFTDFYQDVATCSFGDMLWDNERNEMFKLALKMAITKRKKEGKSTHVLDIGTGTGLLAMMAVEENADSVVACEMFRPVAQCARSIIEQNGYQNKIRLVNKKSTELIVAPDGDLPVKVDILVSEVFDTELIGEGAIETFNHAHSFLLKKDAVVIPSAGTIYCQVISSDSLQRWNKLENWMDGENCILEVPETINQCPGAAALFDIQLSQLPRKQFTCLSEPFPVFKFDFMLSKNIPLNENIAVKIIAKSEGKAQVIFMWWDLMMDEDGQVILSCAPVWAHPKGTEGPPHNPAISIPWRDHWMQAVYFLRNEEELAENELFSLRGWHDEYSFWFALCKCSSREMCKCQAEAMPMCQCGLHLIASRTRLAALNDPFRRSVYTKALKKLLTKVKRFIILGDMSMLGLVLAKLGAEQVDIILQENVGWAERVYKYFPIVNSGIVQLHQNFESLSVGTLGEKAGDVCIMAEPFFQSSLLPMDNLRFYHLKNELAASLLAKNKKILVYPRRAEVKCICVAFDDLWKINRPLVSCQGFHMKVFDELISAAKAMVHNQVEPQPLWEYPCKAVSSFKSLLTLHLDSFADEMMCESNLLLHTFTGNERVDGVALWVEYYDDSDVISTGPVAPTEPGQYITWAQCERQGVVVFHEDRCLSKGNSALSCAVSFDPNSCEFNITFK